MFVEMKFFNATHHFVRKSLQFFMIFEQQYVFIWKFVGFFLFHFQI
jgi:hypothetical protein